MEPRKKPTGRPNRSRPEILKAFEVVGDMTSVEIANVTGIKLRTVQVNLEKMLDDDVIRVVDWIRDQGQRGDPIPVYRIGPGRSVPKPRPYTEAEKRANSLARKRRRRARVAIKGKLKRRASTGNLNVFSAMAIQLGARNGKVG